MMPVKDFVSLFEPSSTSEKSPSGFDPTKGNFCELCGVACFSISIVPGLILFFTVHL